MVTALAVYQAPGINSQTSIRILDSCDRFGIAARPPPLWNPQLSGTIPCPTGTEYYPFTRLCHFLCPSGYTRTGPCECQMVQDAGISDAGTSGAALESTTS